MEEVKTASYVKPCRACGSTDRYAPVKGDTRKLGKCKNCRAVRNAMRPTTTAGRAAIVKNPRKKKEA